MERKLIFVLALLVVAVVIGLRWRGTPEVSAGELDGFAQCLRDKGVVMYGADWCPHCQNEKRVFGTSFRFVNYVECPKDPKRCLEKKVEGYPTWIFSDGRRLAGEQGVNRLAAASGCKEPPKTKQ